MTKALVVKQNFLPIPALSDTSGLSSYLNFVHNVPMLTEEEEKQYALRLQQQGDLEAAQKLIMSHLRFVARIAKGFSGYGLPTTDLIQEGNIGLMKAVKRFNPDLNVRLVSFAVHWIKAEIHEYILKNWRIVKIATTKSQRKLFFNLRSSKKRLGWFSQEEINAVAEDLNVKPETVIEMEKRMNAYDMTFDAPLDSENDEVFTPAMFLKDESESPEELVSNQDMESHMTSKLMLALDNLDERSQDILRLRWLADEKATLHDLADKYGVSAERVRQLEASAMEKIKTVISKEAA
ncbi:RNA polymerase sigma factor RpoH [Francisellaceae bacterium]|nr:RNA polymerase sigma factor RpoH [Francisellaceae bacterium]